MKHVVRLVARLHRAAGMVCLWLLGTGSAAGEAMLQYFNTSWEEITRRMPEVAEAGYSSLWLPPPTKGSGGLSVGYDLWDPFDLGSKDQRGTFRTRYGTETELLRLVETAHRFGIRVYFDNIMNHRAFDVPGYNDHAPHDLYPGMRPEDFHLRKTADGRYRKWDNVREWWSEWQVQNLGLADLIDIANEPGTTNRNFGGWEGATAAKIKYLRQPNHPEYYCYDAAGKYVGFGKGNGLTVEYLKANEAYYSEYVEDYLHRAARWLLDRTKADGFRLDAVKHVPADFFGATYGADRDRSSYGYLGQAQEQFNLTRGFSDWDNHRDTVFDTERPRDDAMMFGEHLGAPPATGDYVNAGMRLLDNDLRHFLNGQLGNPWGSLRGLDASGSRGFDPAVSVMHAQSHDSDYAARRELQHALYLTRGGIGIIYSDGNHKAGLLKGSGGAFPRHANTNFLGQWGDNRIPNLLYVHEHFARGYQRGRWSDDDVVVYERVDKRENPGMSDAAGTVGLIMLNDNYASGQARSFTTGFPAVGGTDDDAYLFNYSSYGGGFYKYASQLNQVVIPAGGYFIFSWRSPESSDLWERSGGHPLTLLQDGNETGYVTTVRTDGSDGDPGFNPYGLPDADRSDFSYRASVPRVTAGKNLKFVVRTDGSAENVMLKLDGGMDLNGNGRRDHPPALSTDVFLGYEQMSFVGRQGPEKFAARDVARNTIGSLGAETYWWNANAGTFSTVNGSGDGAQAYPDDTAEWVFHDPEKKNDRGADQFGRSGNVATVWAKVGYAQDVNQLRLYYVTDASNPEGAGGTGLGSAKVVHFAFSHLDAADGKSDWWKATLPLPASGVLKYKIGAYRNTTGGNSTASVFPKNAPAVAFKKKMLTTFELGGFDADAVEYHPHNDYGQKAKGLKEGFHVVRARAFLSRLGEASIYNTFTRTFYYDAKRPEGEINFPGSDGAELFGSEYGFVLHTDPSVTEVLFHVDDSDPTNDDARTGSLNGNGDGFEAFRDVRPVSYVVDPAWLDRVEQVADWSLARGLVTVINAHGEDWFTDNPADPKNEAKFLDIWRQVAARFKDKSENLLFEIINEPYGDGNGDGSPDLSAEQVNALNRKVLAEIRRTNPTRIVILTGGGKSSYEAPLQLDDALFTQDPYLLATFHYYKPFPFTKNGVGTNTRYTWGTAADKQAMTADFDAVKNWAAPRGVSVFLGEFGANDSSSVSPSSRVEFHRYAAQQALARGFSFAAWDEGVGDKPRKSVYLRSPGSWDAAVRDALLATPKPAGGASTGGNPVTPAQMVRRMGRGINLGNTMNAAKEGNWQAAAQEHYFDDYKNAGFDSVRIPVRWGTHVTEERNRYDLGEPFDDRNGNGVRDVSAVTAWARAEEVSSRRDETSPHPKEWRFRYRNVPAGGGEATVRIALREISSSENLSLSEEQGHFRILTRKVKTNGTNHRLFVAWPQANGDEVGENYVLRTYLSSSLVDGLSDAQVLANLTVSVDASIDGKAPYPSAVAQDLSGAWVERNIAPGLAAVAYKLPVLRNPAGAPDDFRQTLVIDYKNPGAGIDLRALRAVTTDYVDHGPVNPVLTVNGVNADYTVTNFFLDEVAGEEETVEVVLEVANATAAQVYTNLNNRDLATADSNLDGIEDGMQAPPRDSVTLANNAGYYRVTAMTFDPARGESGAWVATLKARKTGAYRLSARFKLKDDVDVWRWFTDDGRRDHAIVATPKSARSAVLYELNPLTADATGDTFATRSTFEDLHDSTRWNLDYLKGLGANWLWFQPVHPRGSDGRERVNGQPYDPGSPYAVKNFFEIMPQLAKANTRPAAMQAFQNFVAAADDANVSVMVDAPFNHVAWDVELDEKGVEIFGTGAAGDEIRKTLPGFFSRSDDYGLPARNEAEIATAPDRDDFGKWNDVKDVYFGQYSALVRGADPAERNAHQNEEDVFDYAGPGWNAQTRKTWKYFASYVPYWLEKTGLPAGQPLAAQARKGIDGLRADFGQGLPPRLWEYVVNVARSRKWNFIFMSEALDGGPVTYRSSRHFDVLNENLLFALKSADSPGAYRAALENRRASYGPSLVLLNNVSHDEESLQDPWQAFIRYAVAGTNDGLPMLFMGQELGISRTYGFNHYETNFGKQVPHFKRYNSMQPIWNNADFGLDQLYKAYASIGRARTASSALRSPHRHFLDDATTNAPHGKIHAVAKWEKPGASPAEADLVLAFVNLDRDNEQAATFDLSPGGNEALFGIQPDHLYNVSNLAAFRPENANDFLWTKARSGRDLLENGIYVKLNPVPATNAGWGAAPYEAQFLKVRDLSAPRLDLNATSGGAVTGAGVYTYGKLAAISAVARPGHAFVRWNGDGVTNPLTPRTTVAMTQPRAVTAVFRYVADPDSLPVISEFVASNKKSLFSASGESHDWIEIHNPGSAPVNLSDWRLTNDPANPNVWSFPAGTVLDADERLVVFASGLGASGGSGGTITRKADLLAYWAFDEGGGSTSRDRSGRGRDLSSIGGATWTDGKFGKALSFDGGSLSLPLAAHPPASGTEFTVTFWSYGDPVKLPGKNTSVFESHGASGRVLNVHHPWNDRVVYWDAGNGGSDRINALIEDKDLWGAWSHWAFTHNRATGNQKFYLNGVEKQSAAGRTRQLGAPVRWFLGANGNGNTNFWYGKIDEFRAYGKELTAAEIAAVRAETPDLPHVNFRLDADGGYLALVRSDGTIGSVFANYPKQKEDYAYGTPEKVTGLRARWKFDEASGNLAKDAVTPPAGLVAGHLAGNPNLTDPNPGNLNGNGSGAANGLDPLGPSLGNTNASPPWQGNFTVVYTGQIFDADGKMSFTENIDDATWLKVNQQVLINDAAWNNRASQTADFGTGGWFDFELRMSNGSGGAGAVSAPGFGFDPAGGSNFVFPRNSSSGMADLFRTRPPHDASFTGVSSPTRAPGKFGNALRFDGVDDVATHALPAPLTLPAYTLSLWVKPDDPNQANYVSFFNSGSTGKDFQIGFDGGGRFKLFGDSGGGTFGAATTGWSHLAVVCDGSSRKLYLDGAQVATVANADNVFQHFRFGVNRGGTLFYKGLLDDVRLYEQALSDAQVRDLTLNQSGPSHTYLKAPTPGSGNDVGFEGFVADTTFSVDRGFYETPFQLAISSATPGATIRYTLDGSLPSETQGSVYAGPIPIASTTIVRAIAYKAGHVSTNVDTQSYFFLNDVIRQSADGSTPTGWPATDVVKNQKMVYGMDPDVVDAFNTPAQVKEALLAIPTLSIATDLKNLFDADVGIYVNARSDGRAWERPMSLELLNPDGSKGFQANSGLRMRGGYSRSPNNPKHSFRVFFRREYGPGNLNYSMFEDEGTEEFDKFDLRTSQNYSWAFGGPANNTMVREVWSRDTMGAMGQPYSRSRYYHLYLNGTYWGIYMTQERVSGTMASSYYGGDKSDYDTVHQDNSRSVNATSGNLQAYDRLWQRTIDGWTNNADYFRYQGLEPDGKTRNPAYERLLDVDNLIDYMLIVYYNGDRDGPASRYTTPRVNNYYAFYNRKNPDGWKFPPHDMEHSLGRGENNMVTPLASAHPNRSEKRYFTSHFLHEQLTSNPEYVMRFADRFYLRHYNDGLLTEENAKARITFRANQIDKAIIAESARWGDTKSATPKNRNDWVNNVNAVYNWMKGRNAVVLNQVRTTRLNASSPFWYPSIDPPGFTQHGGQVGSAFRLTMTNPNATPVTIHYTVDGSDPRLIGGGLSPTAKVAQPGGLQSTLLLDAGAAAKALVPTNNALGSAWTQPGFDDSSWLSGPSGMGYDTATTYRSLFGIDLMSPMRNKNSSAYCRIPFTVTGASSFTHLTLKMKYDDGFVAYLNGQQVASANAPSNPTWNSRATSGHSDSAAVQYLSFDLSPHLAHLREGANVLAVHGLNVSNGSSDFLIVPRLEASKVTSGTKIALPNPLTTVKARARTGAGEWSALHEATFQVDVVPASHENLAVSEIMYAPAGTGGSEYVEVRNVGSLRIDLTGVTLGGAFDDFTFGPLTLAPGESAVVVQDLATFQARYLDASSPYHAPGLTVAGQWPGGKLNNGGETLKLTDAKGAEILTFRYDNGGDWPGRADGRGSSLVLPKPSALAGKTPAERNAYLADGDNWKSSPGFHGSPGAAEPADAFEQLPSVLISEILAHTDPPLLDAIELHNPGAQAADVSGWRLTEKSSTLTGFRIPDGTIIPPGGYLVFDERDFNPNGLWNPNPGTRGPNEFALSGAKGGSLRLIRADAAGNLLAFVDKVDFDATFNGVSLGRWPNGSAGDLHPMKERSLFDESAGAYPPVKQPGPNKGPKAGQIILSEIMFDPAGGNPDLEYLELYNAGDSPVPLDGWKLDKGVSFDFPPGSLLKPGQSLVVVGFDLNATDKLAAFRAAYNVGPKIPILGGWKGNLNNGGETIALLRPDTPPPDDPTHVPMVVEEAVTYSNAPPWPADSNGTSLVRKKKDAWSNDPSGWERSTGTPSPGPSPTLNSPPVFTHPALPATLPAGATLRARVTASDPDGNALTFSAPSLPFWLALRDDANGSALLYGSPPPYAIGQQTVSIQTSDGIAPPVTQDHLLTVEDKTPPILTLRGDSNLTLEAGSTYADAGVIAADSTDGDLSASVRLTGSVNPNLPGTYLLRYDVSDKAGNAAATATRTVKVADTRPPVIHLRGEVNATHEAATPFTDPGAYALDSLDGNLTNLIVTGSVNVNLPGTHTLSYNVSDQAGNAAATVTRNVTVADTAPPALALLGSPSVQHKQGNAFTDPGASATDSLDGNLTASIRVTGSVQTGVVGTYTLHYDVSDQAGNAAPRLTRTVTVVEKLPPVLTLFGPATVTIDEGQTYVEPGYSATDATDGNLTASVVVDGSVNASQPGSYLLTYDVTNSEGTPASRLTRAVIVRDVTPPALALLGPASLFHEAATPFTDPGASAGDNADGDLSASVQVTGFVNPRSLGLQLLHYDVSDRAGNAATRLTRSVTVRDATAPVVTLRGEANATHEAATPYAELGATALDSFAGDLTSALVLTGEVNATKPGTQLLTYSVKDPAGNLGSATRQVRVIDTTPPLLTLLGEANATIEAGYDESILETRATAFDALDGSLASAIVRSGTVDYKTQGDYVLRYDVSDQAGNAAATKVRNVRVRDTRPPSLSLLGSASLTIRPKTPWNEPGARAFDLADGDLSASVNVQGDVDVNRIGKYLLTYSVSDKVGNAATTVTREVSVLSDQPPVLTLLGPSSVSLDQGAPFRDPGVRAHDPFDGNLTHLVRAYDNLDVNVPGAHTITYVVTNASGLSAEEVVRTVVIRDLNDAPSTNGVETYLSDVPMAADDQSENPGNAVSSLVEGVSDLDSNARPGIALVGADASDGVWQYSLDGGKTFANADNLSAANALLLRADDSLTLLRFRASPIFHGKASVTFRAWDQTAGANGSRHAITTTGGRSAFSADSAKITVNVVPRSDAPFFITKPNLFATATRPYAYEIRTRDPNGDTLALQAVAKPAWLALVTRADGSATLSGTPGAQDAGPHAVILKVTDSSGKFAEQSFAVAVSSGKVFDLRPGWRALDWFGDFYVAYNGWLYHPHHGWLRPFEKPGGKDGVWFWSEQLGWTWTREDVYPFLFLRSRQRTPEDAARFDDMGSAYAWFYYKPGSTRPRLFYDYAASAWITEDQFPPIPVTANLSDPQAGLVSGIGSYGRGDRVTLTARANPGYEFLGWSGLPSDASPNSSSPTVTFTATKQTVLTARFRKLTDEEIIKGVFD